MHPILETTLISDVREPLKEMVTCGFLKKNVTADEQHCCYSVCCTDNHNRCFIFNLINVAVLPQDHTSITNVASASNQNGQAENMEIGPASEDEDCDIIVEIANM